MKSPEMLAGSLQPGPESKRGSAGAWSRNVVRTAKTNPKSQLEPRGQSQNRYKVNLMNPKTSSLVLYVAAFSQ